MIKYTTKIYVGSFSSPSGKWITTPNQPDPKSTQRSLALTIKIIIIKNKSNHAEANSMCYEKILSGLWC